MYFRIPSFDFFLKKKNSVVVDDDDDMPDLVARHNLDMPCYDSHKKHHGGHHVGSFCTDDRDGIVVESLTFSNADDDGDDDGDFVFVNSNEPRPAFSRYRAMLKREKERRLDMEFLDMYAPVVDGSVPLPFAAVRFPIPTVLYSQDDEDVNDGGKALKDISSTKGSRERDPLSYFDKDTLRIAKQAMQEQVDQKKVELRNLGMDIPNDQTIFEGLGVAESYGFINAAINKASKQKGYNEF
jgi:hypothetical protein